MPDSESQAGAAESAVFDFRPWVRSTCRRAALWTAVLIVLLMVAVIWQGGLSGAPLARALGVLAAYGAVFLLTLAKIWWTAGRPAAGWDQDGLWFQALHRFRPTRIDWDRVLAAGAKPDSRAYRLAVRRGGDARERFLNLAVIRSHHEFVDGLERNLALHGLEAKEHGWARPGWSSDADRLSE